MDYSFNLHHRSMFILFHFDYESFIRKMGNCFHMFNAQCGMKIGVLHCPTQMETNRSIPATGDIFIGIVPIRHSVIVLVSEPRCI